MANPIPSCKDASSSGLVTGAGCMSYCSPMDYFHNQASTNCLNNGDTAWMVRLHGNCFSEPPRALRRRRRAVPR